MTGLAAIALVVWPAIVLVLFLSLPDRRAVLSSLIVGWLFLPIGGISVAALPDYDKATACCGATFFASLLCHWTRWETVRPAWFDLPILLWCVCPIASSIVNGLGVYDGVSMALERSVTWLFAYALGRVYFRQLADFRELAVAVLLGGLVYVPLCLYEVRMSPQLHNIVYGWHQHSFVQTMRPGGGYRPMVFMHHGLMTSLWMSGAAILGLWMMFCKSVSHILEVPAGWLVAPLTLTAILCKSLGALALLFLGCFLLLATKLVPNRIIIVGVLLLPLLYVGAHIAQAVPIDSLRRVAQKTVGEHRTHSLLFRIENEELLVDKALRQPLFGWGGWGRSRIYDDDRRDISVTDGLWVIAAGENGLFGLSVLMVTLLLPAALFVWRIPPQLWDAPAVAPLAGLTVLTLVYAIDCIPNAMVNPVFHVVLGALANPLRVKELGNASHSFGKAGTV